MSDEWIYEHAGRIHGPVSLADLRASLALGLVWPTDLVRRRIVQDWPPATRFPELQNASTIPTNSQGAQHPNTSKGAGTP